MGMVAASCSNDESLDSSVNPSNEQSQLAPVTVSVSGFAVSQSDFSDTDNPQGTRATTRATAVGDYSGLKKLTLAFYKSDGTETYKVTHTKESMGEGETFGEFSTSLPLGSYTMVVLGYVLYDDDEKALQQYTALVNAELNDLSRIRESKAATDSRAWLHIAMFIATGKPHWRNLAKAYIKNYNPKSTYLQQFVKQSCKTAGERWIGLRKKRKTEE